MPSICCSIQRHPDDPTLSQYFSTRPTGPKGALTISPILAVALLTLGTLALVGLHHPTSALGPFGAGVGMAGAASMVAIGSLAALFTGVLMLAFCQAYRWECDRLARPLNEKEADRMRELGRAGKFQSEEFRQLKARLDRNGYSF